MSQSIPATKASVSSSSAQIRVERNGAFGDMKSCPPDALLGLIDLYQHDPRKHKLDLGVGVYQNDSNKTPTMRAVTQAERLLSQLTGSKVYEGARGNIEFCERIEQLVLGDQHTLNLPTYYSMATPGGCGALYLALAFCARSPDCNRVWMSSPSWPNHQHISRQVGLEVKEYKFVSDNDFQLDFDSVVETLQQAEKSDVVLLQGTCHNPTGIDLSVAQWQSLSDICSKKELIPLIDIAYHGLGTGLDEDLAGVRAFLDQQSTAFISYSCSKNFGLYRDRTGCLIAKTGTPTDNHLVSGHLNDIARACYSMPPAHGCAIVSYILKHELLTIGWQTELSEMRFRLRNLREALAQSLVAATDRSEFEQISHQNGMFTQLPLTAAHSAALRSEQAIYVPQNGRINIAGLNLETIDPFVRAVSEHLSKAR